MSGEVKITGTGYLIDASALYPLLLRVRRDIFRYLSKLYILDLTIYEVGSALVKEARAGRVRDLEAVTELFQEVFKNINIVRIEPEIKDIIKDIANIALRNKLTFYDACYIYVAERLGFRLVTEDRDLLRNPLSIDVETFIKETHGLS